MFKILKFNPQMDSFPYYEKYFLEISPRETILWALIRIQESQDPDLSFRYNCKDRKCGECGVLVNRKPYLACEKKVETNQTIEPLSFFRVVKDLVVETEVFLKRTFREIFAGLSVFKPTEHISSFDLNILKKYVESTQCLGCLLCQTACPMVRDGKKKFRGPFPFLVLSQIALDPRWQGNLGKMARRMGIKDCTRCRNCKKVCPQDLDLPNFFKFVR